MPWQPGESGNPGGRQKHRPYRDALRMELAAYENGLPVPEVPENSLRAIARAHIRSAANGDITAIDKLADRIEGKVPQAVVGDDSEDPVSVRNIVTGVPRAGDD